MIVALVPDPYLRSVVEAAGHPEEDVVTDAAQAVEAIEFGFPRLVILSGTGRGALVGARPDLATLILERERLSRWERERLAAEVPEERAAYLARRLQGAIAEYALESTWVDRCLADLSRAVGAPLPPPLRSFGRRVLEFPTHYQDLGAVARAVGVSRGALKARFRRRGLESPYTYLRWFRILAVAYHLSDRGVTVAQAAHRLGFTSDGNLCRAVLSFTGMTTKEIRTLRGWNRLLVAFAWTYLTRPQLCAWGTLGDLFIRDVA